jgi:hypothetical protein
MRIRTELQRMGFGTFFRWQEEVDVARLYDVAQLLVSSWALASPREKLPTPSGVLDRALKNAIDTGVFPEWAAAELHFAESRVGLRCVELPRILEWAQTAQLTSAPNPSYSSADLKIGPRAARVFLRRLDVPEEVALEIGRQLKNALDSELIRNERA